MPVPKNYDGFRKEGSEHHVDHMSVMKSNPVHLYGHMPVPTYYDGLGRKEGSEHHVYHMSVMKSNPAYTHMVICLFL
jgi:hypothetical protein